MDLKELIIELYDVGGLKFGDFTVRTGEHTPVYIDMRIIWSYPKIVISVCQHMWKLIEEKQLKFKSLVGLPYQGIPIATYLSTQHMVPMLMKRQSQKQYGTKKSMEGHFEKGDKVLIIDDVLMTGTTLLESADYLRNESLVVDEAVLFIDRIQGGSERVKHVTGMKTHSVTDIEQTLQILTEAGKLDMETAEKSRKYLKENRFDTPDKMVPLESSEKK